MTESTDQTLTGFSAMFRYVGLFAVIVANDALGWNLFKICCVITGGHEKPLGDMFGNLKWVFPKNRGGPPKSSIFNRVFHEIN